MAQSQGIASNLPGRWACGSYRKLNLAYVSEDDRERKKTYPPEANRMYTWCAVIEPIVAVSMVPYEDRLRLWVLVEGVPQWLCASTAVVMPSGWVPEIPR